jgi:hypothetical protein
MNASPPDRTSALSTFEELVAEGASVPVAGWDFSWFEGRASEERPSWGYARMMSEHVGAGTVRELTDFMMGPQPVSEVRSTERALVAAEAAGLIVVDLRHESLRTEFYDIGAVVHFLRKVIWIVPGFTVDRYRERLARLHQRIASEGPFVATTQRFLIEARQPS